MFVPFLLHLPGLVDRPARSGAENCLRSSENLSNHPVQAGKMTMAPELDSRDRAILRILQGDGRITNSDLAEKVHLSPSACLRRVRQLEESGLIRGYAMLLDDKIAGFPGTAFVFVTLDQQGRASLEGFEQAVRDLPEILECHLLAGAHDYLMRVIYRDSADFERIHKEELSRLPGVASMHSAFALRTIKAFEGYPVSAAQIGDPAR